jgi:uncharacterized membrane protein (DUF4010 family)
VGHAAVRLAVALGIGLLLGVERERRKGRGPERGEAGVRTFALVALLGGLSLRVGGEVTAAVALGFVAVAAIVGYLRSGDEDPGITTEVALVVDFLLGGLAQREPGLAAGLAVATALMLAGRDRIHKLVSDTLSEQELHDGLLFAACALIVLPLVPDKGIGPNEAFNPATVWRLVVVVMALQALGYMALRAIGVRYGMLVAGFVGGFVSSTATIGTMGARAVKEPALRRGATAAAVVSSLATVILLAIVVGVADRPTLRKLALPLVLSGVAAVGYAALFAVRVVRMPTEREFEQGRAFDLRVALILALTVSVVLVVSGLLNEALGRTGVVLSTAVAGFADSQSAAISAATLASEGHVSTETAVIAVLAALTTNTVSKAVVAVTIGKRRFAVQVLPGLVLILVGAWAGWAIVRAI